MKKSFLILMLMLVSAVVMNAQSLTGKQWVTKLGAEDGIDVIVALAFDNDGTCEMLVATEYEMKEDGVPITLTGSVSVPGTFTLKDKDLTMNLDRKQAEVDLDYEIKGMDAKTKELMDKEIKDEINSLKGDFKKEMLDGMPKMHNMKIVSLESKARNSSLRMTPATKSHSLSWNERMSKSRSLKALKTTDFMKLQ